jgi:hypothetical protein
MVLRTLEYINYFLVRLSPVAPLRWFTAVCKGRLPQLVRDLWTPASKSPLSRGDECRPGQRQCPCGWTDGPKGGRIACRHAACLRIHDDDRTIEHRSQFGTAHLRTRQSRMFRRGGPGPRGRVLLTVPGAPSGTPGRTISGRLLLLRCARRNESAGRAGQSGRRQGWFRLPRVPSSPGSDRNRTCRTRGHLSERFCARARITDHHGDDTLANDGSQRVLERSGFGKVAGSPATVQQFTTGDHLLVDIGWEERNAGPARANPSPFPGGPGTDGRASSP